ncbi:hypothetical protein [Psychromicrobium xiongbiense]|uniref:hypothetical protein n=1 Tax=Psychromicrobium xiongbiense TaxID=3051184 RepID=UPI002555A701|nr:hypothetical protein [Psychromicrobium sp. YIM S02556]
MSYATSHPAALTRSERRVLQLAHRLTLLIERRAAQRLAERTERRALAAELFQEQPEPWQSRSAEPGAVLDHALASQWLPMR